MAAVFLYLVYIFAAAVISALSALVLTLGGVSLAVFIGKAGAKSAQNIVADEILAGDKFNIFFLPLLFLIYKLKDYGFYLKRPLLLYKCLDAEILEIAVENDFHIIIAGIQLLAVLLICSKCACRQLSPRVGGL